MVLCERVYAFTHAQKPAGVVCPLLVRTCAYVEQVEKLDSRSAQVRPRTCALFRASKASEERR